MSPIHGAVEKGHSVLLGRLKGARNVARAELVRALIAAVVVAATTTGLASISGPALAAPVSKSAPACGLAASRNVAPDAGPGRVAPLSASRLFTKSDAEARRVESGPSTFLTHGERRRVVASIDEAQPGVARVAWYAASTDVATDPEEDLATLEQLYSLVLSRSPSLKFSIGFRRRSEPATLSHGEMLAEIAAARSCASARSSAATRAASSRWESVVVRPLKSNGLDVGVRVLNGSRPVVKAQVSFARGAHFTCSAETDDSGAARCKLYDPHGGDAESEHERDDPTIASFGGVVSDSLILLPTTKKY